MYSAPALIFAKLKKLVGVVSAIAGSIVAGVNRRDVPVYLDVGSRGGLPSRWRLAAAAKLVLPVYVEPDPVEAAALAKRFPGTRLIRAALGANDGHVATLRITCEPGRSSLLEPDTTAIAAFAEPGPWQVERTETLVVRRLDQIWGEATPPTFVKVDVQGYELEVLRGMGTMLDSVLCVEVEASLCRFYTDQATLEDVREFMFDKGFDLVRIAALGLYRDQAMVEFNTFWVRRSAHENRNVRFWKKINGVGNIGRVNVWGY